ncbi:MULTISPECIES: hypothetical protein [Spirulina sp. CCY15215]|uniref:hypothetical protein n=1 Tax=Spirulina sp. CCY15215 TaxID=2767591 RepID=UPI00194FF2A7|nr:hypothetical protein [Spirulina major]
MRLIHTKATVENGKLFLDESLDNLPAKIKRVNVIIAIEERENSEGDRSDSYEELRQIAKANGYDTREKIIDLIKQVKFEILEEGGY